MRSILGVEGYEELVEIAKQGTEHGGISIFTPALSRLFKMEQYRGEQPQFVHRWLLKRILARGVNVVRGGRVDMVSKREEEVDIVFADGTTKTADLVIGERYCTSTLS